MGDKSLQSHSRFTSGYRPSGANADRYAFRPIKCDFCDMTIRNDLDLSKHIKSQSHNSNKKKFIDEKYRDDAYVEKRKPKNLAQLYEALRIRNVRNLQDLADKGYFEIKNEGLCEVAESLARTLVYASLRFESLRMPEEIQRRVKDLVHAMKEDENRNAPKDKEETPLPVSTPYQIPKKTQPKPTATSQAEQRVDAQSDASQSPKPEQTRTRKEKDTTPEVHKPAAPNRPQHGRGREPTAQASRSVSPAKAQRAFAPPRIDRSPVAAETRRSPQARFGLSPSKDRRRSQSPAATRPKAADPPARRAQGAQKQASKEHQPRALSRSSEAEARAQARAHLQAATQASTSPTGTGASAAPWMSQVRQVAANWQAHKPSAALIHERRTSASRDSTPAAAAPTSRPVDPRLNAQFSVRYANLSEHMRQQTLCDAPQSADAVGEQAARAQPAQPSPKKSDYVPKLAKIKVEPSD